MWIDGADSGELATALIPAVWTFLGVVVVTLGTILVQSMKARSERSSASQQTSPPTNGNGSAAAQLLQVARDVARDIGQLDQRADDSDLRDDIQDRELRDQRNTLDEHHRRLLRLEQDRGWLDD